jgi:hypothetical protein
MGGRSNDANQRPHLIAAGGTVAEVGPQRRGQRRRIGSGFPQGELFGDELAHVVGLQLVDHDRPVREFPQQQALDEAQTTATCACTQAPHVAHVFVVAAQLVGDRTARQRGRGDGALFPKHGQQMAARGAQITVYAHHRLGTVAARQVLAEELPDGTLVQKPDRKTALGHPARQMRETAKVPGDGVGRVPSSFEASGIDRGVGCQNAAEQPSSRRRIKRCEVIHGGLRKWEFPLQRTAEIMSSPPSPLPQQTQRRRPVCCHQPSQLHIIGGCA